jgi:hypothetical protein
MFVLHLDRDLGSSPSHPQTLTVYECPASQTATEPLGCIHGVCSYGTRYDASGVCTREEGLWAGDLV